MGSTERREWNSCKTKSSPRLYTVGENGGGTLQRNRRDLARSTETQENVETEKSPVQLRLIEMRMTVKIKFALKVLEYRNHRKSTCE